MCGELIGPAGFAVANVSALMQMQVRGVSTRKVAKAAAALCGHGFSASTISRLNSKLDAELGKFAERRLEGSFPYLILDARYEKVREDGVVRDRAVLIAVGVDAAGRRQVLGVELAEGESHASWRRFLESLRDRGLCGVVQVVSDDHSGLTKAIREVVPEAVRQRCCVHFLQNARAHSDRRSGDGCLKELRWIYDRPSVEEARRDLGAWLSKWQESQPKLCDRVEETFAFLRLPRQHHLRMRSTNMLERLNEEIKRRRRSSGFSRTPAAVCGWSGPCAPRRTRAGWRTAAATWTWIFFRSSVGPVCASWRHDGRAVRIRGFRPSQFAQGAASMESLWTIPSGAVGARPAPGRD